MAAGVGEKSSKINLRTKLEKTDRDGPSRLISVFAMDDTDGTLDIFYHPYVVSKGGAGGYSMLTAATIAIALLASAAVIWTLGPRRERNR